MQRFCISFIGNKIKGETHVMENHLSLQLKKANWTLPHLQINQNLKKKRKEKHTRLTKANAS